MLLSVRNSTAPRPGRIRDFRHGLLGSGTRPVFDRQKVSTLPTAADVLRAIDALDRERKRLKAAQRQAELLGID